MAVSLAYLLETRKKAIIGIGAGIGVLLLGFFLLANLAAVKSDVTGWKKADAAAPPELVAKAIAQNFTPADSDSRLDPSRVRVFVVGDKPKLYIFDFNTPSLCGIAGCVHAIYTEKGEPVLRLILRPELPKGVPLLQIGENQYSKSPCLIVSQPSPPSMSTAKTEAGGELISKTLYCYSGSGMARFNSWIESRKGR